MCRSLVFCSVRANAYNVITDAQFGFQPNIGTAEAIFCLSSIIHMSLRNKKKEDYIAVSSTSKKHLIL